MRLSFGNKSQTRTTDADGKYRFADLLAGKYTVKVVAPAGFRVAGDDAVGVTTDGKRDRAVDFRLVSTAPASPVAITSAQGAASQGTAAQQGSLPATVPPPSAIVRTSPVPVANASPVPSHGDSALALTAPSVVVVPTASATPMTDTSSPAASPRAAGPSAAGPSAEPEDVQANLPPRRLITSFSALSDSAREASVGQLRTYANDSSLILGVPFKTQIDGTHYSLVNCGPASLAMVLTAYGIDVDPASVRDYLNYLVGNYDTEIGTSLEHLGRIAREAGLSTLGLYGRGGYRPWTVNDVREYVRAGYPVITLTKYRKLPGHLGSQTDFDHYVVITGLAGNDFVYNDAAYASEYGRNLLISPAELEQAWADSSIPRHAMAVGLGDTVRPLPIVPRRLQPDAVAAAARDPARAAEAVEAREGIEAIQAALPVEPPLGMVPGRATQNLRERLLDDLGARSSIVNFSDGEELENVHPSDVRPEPSALANIRIPAEARPDAEGAPARIVAPGTGASDEPLASTDALIVDTIADETGPVDVGTSAELAAAGASTAAEAGLWSGAQVTGLIGLALMIAGWVVRRRQAAERRSPTELAPESPAAAEL